MTLKKMFLLELQTSILFLSFPILCLFIYTTTKILDIADVIYIILFISYLSFFQIGKKKQNKKLWTVINVAWGISSIISLILLRLAFIYGNKFRIYDGEPLKQFFPIYLIPVWLLLHSIFGLILLKTGWTENNITNFKKSIINLFYSDAYVEINKSLFILILCIGIFFLGFAYYQIQIEELYTFLYPLLIAVQVYDYKSKIKKKQKRKFNEREKYFLFKTISTTSFMFIILLFALFWMRNIKVFGHFLNEMWGIIIFPIFLILWGITGLIMLKKEQN